MIDWESEKAKLLKAFDVWKARNPDGDIPDFLASIETEEDEYDDSDEDMEPDIDDWINKSRAAVKDQAKLEADELLAKVLEHDKEVKKCA